MVCTIFHGGSNPHPIPLAHPDIVICKYYYFNGMKVKFLMSFYFHPSVGKMSKMAFQTRKRYFSKKEKSQIRAMSHGLRCFYCGKQTKPNKRNYDHLIPYSRGGLSTTLNGVISCATCNLKKGKMTRIEWVKKYNQNSKQKMKITCKGITKDGKRCLLTVQKIKRHGQYCRFHQPK